MVARKDFDLVTALLQCRGGIDDETLCSACLRRPTSARVVRAGGGATAGRVGMGSSVGRRGEAAQTAAAGAARYGEHGEYQCNCIGVFEGRVERVHTEAEVWMDEGDPEVRRQMLRRILRRRHYRHIRRLHCSSGSCVRASSSCVDAGEVRARQFARGHVKLRRTADRKRGILAHQLRLAARHYYSVLIIRTVIWADTSSIPEPGRGRFWWRESFCPVSRRLLAASSGWRQSVLRLSMYPWVGTGGIREPSRSGSRRAQQKVLGKEQHLHFPQHAGRTRATGASGASIALGDRKQ